VTGIVGQTRAEKLLNRPLNASRTRPARNLGATPPKIQTANGLEGCAAAAASDVRLLQTGDAALVRHIRDEIEARGPVTFAWFMEQALYHPAHGYYSSGRCTVGRRGDYFTNVSVGPLFGRLMAAQFAEMWETLGGRPISRSWNKARTAASSRAMFSRPRKRIIRCFSMRCVTRLSSRLRSYGIAKSQRCRGSRTSSRGTNRSPTCPSFAACIFRMN
jgi:hypothetical protein